MSDKKLIDVGFQCIWNEEANIRGWAKTMLHFCNRVCAIIDPKTNDKTVEILEKEFPAVEIFWQDRDLGDSDYTTEGPEGNLIMHNNNTHFVQNEIQPGQWVLFLAGDERFHIDDFPLLDREIQFAQDQRQDGIIHTVMNEFYRRVGDVDFIVAFPLKWINQIRFFQIHDPKNWVQNGGAHEGKSILPQNLLYSECEFYHFAYHRVMNNQKKFDNCWVYQKHGDYPKLYEKFGAIPLRAYEGPPFNNWSDLKKTTTIGEVWEEMYQSLQKTWKALFFKKKLFKLKTKPSKNPMKKGVRKEALVVEIPYWNVSKTKGDYALCLKKKLKSIIELLGVGTELFRDFEVYDYE